MTISFALALWPAVHAPAPVTYSANARPLSEIVQGIAEKSGKKLIVSKQLADEIFVVQVDSIDSDDLLKRIAKASYGEWQPEAGDTLRLVPDKLARAAASRAVAAERLAKVQKALKDFDPNKGGDDFFAATGGGQFAVSVQTTDKPVEAPPSTKALGQIMRLIPAKTYAGIGPQQRLVLASSPNMIQTELPMGSSEILDRMVVAHNAWVDKMAKAKSAEGEAKAGEQVPEGLQALIQNQKDRYKPLTEPAVKAIVSLSRGGLLSGIFGGDVISAELKLYGKSGKVLLQSSSSLTVQEGTGMVVIRRSTDKPAEKPAIPAGQKITYSKESQSFQHANNLMEAAMGGNLALSADVKALLLQPTTRDPLSFVWGEGLMQTATVEKANVIAQLSDGLVANIMGDGAPKTDTEFLNQIKDHGQLTQTDGWIEFRPTDPALSDAIRVNRADLGRLMKAGASKMVPSLDDLAAYAAHNEPPMSTPVVMPYMRLTPSMASGGMSGMMNWDALRLYGLLSAGERIAVFQGGLPYAGATPEQKAVLSHMLFGPNTRFMDEATSRKKEEGSFWEIVSSFMGDGGNTTYRDEPTELMPQGLPPQGTIIARSLQDFIGMPMGTDGKPTTMYGALGTDEIAMMKMITDSSANNPQIQAYMPKMDHLLVGKRNKLQFRFYAAKDTFVEASLNDDTVDGAQQATAYDQLPDDWRKKIAAKTDQFKKGGGLSFGFGGPAQAQP